jgi:hypothetical protein
LSYGPTWHLVARGAIFIIGLFIFLSMFFLHLNFLKILLASSNNTCILRIVLEGMFVSYFEENAQTKMQVTDCPRAWVECTYILLTDQNMNTKMLEYLKGLL